MSDHGFAGWTGEPPDAEAPGGFAAFLLQQRADPCEGRTLEQVLARASRPDRPPEPYDDGERQAAMVARGYSPGLLSQLMQRLGDTRAELAAEQDKIEKGRKRQEHLHRAHAAGQITAFDIARAQDFDEGDPGRVAQLERRAADLRRQIAEAQGMVSPPQKRAPGPEQAALARAQDAHQQFVQATRERWAEAQGGTPRARRPFVSGGCVVARNGPVTCQACLAVGASEEESFLIHHMDADGWPLSAPSEVPIVVPPDDTGRSAAQAEADRLMRLGFSRETALYAPARLTAGWRSDEHGRAVAIAARYATDTFTVTVNGASHLVVIGSIGTAPTRP